MPGAFCLIDKLLPALEAMKPSSRTPEGLPNRCPVCGKTVRLEPSLSTGDAPCPHCGRLLWFNGQRVLAVRKQPQSSLAAGRADLTPGAAVRITAGVFQNFDAVVEEVMQEAGRVRLSINVFGRPTCVELSCEQVVRITEPQQRPG